MQLSSTLDVISFSLKKSPKVIKYSAEKELEFEQKEYFVNKKLSNKLADYGFVLYEDKVHRKQKFVKVHGDLLIQIR